MAVWNVKGKTFLITGGASGLGAAYVEGFLNEGAKQIAILDIAEDKGKAYAEDLNRKYPDRVIFIKCDVGDEQSIDEAFEKVIANFKRLDVVFNNAGIMSDAPRMWRKMCDVNWRGLVSFTMKGLKHMRKDEGGAGGAIINVASTAALVKTELMPIYCGTKMAVLHFSQSIASGDHYTQTGVRILTICPGPTDTPLLQGLKERGSDARTGEKLEQFLKSEVVCQKIESAVAAAIKMYKEGVNGSIWLSIDDHPGRDITKFVDAAFNIFNDSLIH